MKGSIQCFAEAHVHACARMRVRGGGGSLDLSVVRLMPCPLFDFEVRFLTAFKLST